MSLKFIKNLKPLSYLLPIFTAGTLGCEKARFGGGPKLAARGEKSAASSDRSIETSSKHNFWVVTRQQDEVVRWDGHSVEQGSREIFVNNIDKINVGMKVSGPGIDSQCNDPTTEYAECNDHFGIITDLDPTTKKIKLLRPIRNLQAPIVKTFTPQKSLSATHWIVVPSNQVGPVTAGMLIQGPGLDTECDDISTPQKTCVGAATITSVQGDWPQQGSSRIIFDRHIRHRPVDFENISTSHLSNELLVPDTSRITVGMLVTGPGININCLAPCGSWAAVSSVDHAAKKIILDREIKHVNQQTNHQLVYRFHEPERDGLTYNIRGGSFNADYIVQTGVAHWLEVDGDKVTQHKKWSGIDSNLYDLGLRTYVTEGGVLIGKYPYIYFIDPTNTPEGFLPKENIKSIYDPAKIRDDTRICLASYIKDEKRYMIAAFGAGKYYEIPMADTKPHRPLWDDLSKIPLRQINSARGDEKDVKSRTPALEGIGWGYSCHINQRKKIFYSQWAASGPKRLHDASDSTSSFAAAVDLTTHKEANLDSVVPNAKFVQNNPVLKSFAISVSSEKGSYAVSGDPDGNIYNADRDAILPPFQGASTGEGNSTYTMAYEKRSDTVWVSRNSDKILVIKRKCLTTEPNCTDRDYHFAEVPQVQGETSLRLKTVGPISALKDGRVVGISRSKPSWVRIFSLKDPDDITKGIDVVPLIKIDGDPYMYVDFTGSTLYTRESEQTFKIRDFTGYFKRAPKDTRPDKVAEAHFEWRNIKDTSDDWKGLRLEARCYEDQNMKGSYEEISPVAKAGEKTLLNIPGCQNQFMEFIDIRVTQVKGETLGDVESIKIHIKQ